MYYRKHLLVLWYVFINISGGIRGVTFFHMLCEMIEIIQYADLNYHSLQSEILPQSDIPFCYNFSNLQDSYLLIS